MLYIYKYVETIFDIVAIGNVYYTLLLHIYVYCTADIEMKNKKRTCEDHVESKACIIKTVVRVILYIL